MAALKSKAEMKVHHHFAHSGYSSPPDHFYCDRCNTTYFWHSRGVIKVGVYLGVTKESCLTGLAGLP